MSNKNLKISAISGRLLGEVGYEFNLFFVWLLVSVVFVVVWKQQARIPTFITNSEKCKNRILEKYARKWFFFRNKTF